MDVVGDGDYEDLRLMFQVRHVYVHNLGVVDEMAVKHVPELRRHLGRKYPLRRDAVAAFISRLEQVYQAVVEALEHAPSG